ncbi:prefoldin subunit beta [Candidatus Woesearchaeota archaeon]|nr:prefoldin subunit beta [Candidatus Woesearchaeota archaeon]
MDAKTEEKIAELQMHEQNMQKFLSQKQQFQSQIVEIENALKELSHSKEAHRIVGNIMVKTDKKKIEEDLNSKKEMIELRLKSIDKQEKSMRENADKLQKEVMDEIGKNKK